MYIVYQSAKPSSDATRVGCEYTDLASKEQSLVNNQYQSSNKMNYGDVSPCNVYVAQYY